MNRLKWGRMTVLLVIILGICWFLFQGNQKSIANVEDNLCKWQNYLKQDLLKSSPAKSTSHQKLTQKAAMIIDASDGDIIYQYNENEAFAPASMSKMMTAYLLLESIHNGKVRWEDPVK